MWDLPIYRPWEPWVYPQAPEIKAVLSLSNQPDLVCLAGVPGGTRLGRFGIFGIPRKVQKLGAEPESWIPLVSPTENPYLRVLVLGYELGYPLVQLNGAPPPRGQPAGLYLELEAAILVDHATGRVAVAGQDGPAAEQLAAVLACSKTLVPSHVQADLWPTISDAEHAHRIHRAQAAIAAGDIYQANITRRLMLDGSICSASLFAHLSQKNPVAHGAYIRAGGVEVLSNTMETLLTYDPTTRRASSYPIKGTCKRHPEHCPEFVKLAQDPKERAEHMMIVDLVRNDLGRTCVPGSVVVPQLMGVEGFRGVWHGVSRVDGTLRDDASMGDLLAGLFPGGSITGAPKRRAMEIIADIEGEARGFYTGSVALLAPNGRLSMSILIRTLVRDTEGWSLSVGGGIVADSRAEREIEETHEKVAVFREALSQPESNLAAVC